jgi:hypothetical protein
MFPYSSHVLGRPGRSATAAQLRAEEASVAEVAAVLGRPRALLVRALARTLRGHEGDDRRGSGGHPRRSALACPEARLTAGGCDGC